MNLVQELRAMLVGATKEQIEAWANGELIQNAMPNLTPSQREYILTGIDDEIWEQLFGEDE